MERGSVEEVDLRGVDDDDELSKVLEQQRLMSIKAQQELVDKPVNFSSLQCIICMESITDITVTHCGKRGSDKSQMWRDRTLTGAYF